MKIVPITQAPWGDVAQVFGTRGDPAGCWCQYFKVTNTEFEAGDRAGFESMLKHQAQETPGPGLIAYDDGEPVGWCAVEPRIHTPRIFNSKVSKAGRREPEDDPTVWAVTCIVVRIGHRRRGIGAALLVEAVAFAKESGAKVIEGYPVDTASGAKVSSAELFHGTVSMFEAAGFDIVAQPTLRRSVVRLEIDGP